jgi:hypothetical protein
MKEAFMRMSIRGVIVFLCVFGWGVPALQAAEGHIEWRISLMLKEDDVRYGDWIRVFLVREAVAVSSPGDLSDLGKHEKIERLISAHVDFFKKVMDKMNDPHYIVAETLTTPDGTFKFYGLAPGRYYVVVTLPSMIYGYKVAWQVPAPVTAGKTLKIELNNSNLAVPTYRR